MSSITAHIVNGVLYVIDRDGGTGLNNPAVPVIRKFNMQTGAPAGEIRRGLEPGVDP